MTVGTGITEVADSEDEPLTSSPVAVSNVVADKLSSAACQDTQAMARPHQETTESIAHEASNRTDGSSFDQERLSPDVAIAQNDHVDLQSATQAETNFSSTCVAEEQLHTNASLSPVNVAAACESHQTASIDTDGENGEASTAKDAGHVPAARSPTEYYDREPSSTDTYTNAEECEQERPRLDFRKSLPSDSAHIGIEQLGPSQHEGAGNRVMVPDQGSNDTTHIQSNQRILYRDGASKRHQNEARDVIGEALAGLPQHDVTQTPSVEPPVSVATEHPVSSMKSSYTISRTMGQAPAVTNMARLLTEPAQHAVDRPVTQPELYEPDHTILQNHLSVAASNLPTGANSTSRTNANSHGLDISGTFPSTIASQANSTDVHELQVEEKADDNLNHEPEGQDPAAKSDSLDQAPAASADERCFEQVHVIKESSEGKQLSQMHERPVPSQTATASTFHHSNIVPTGVQLQSTASQGSEPASPPSIVKLSPQEITLAELKAQKSALLASLGALPAIQVLIEESQTSDVDVSDDGGGSTETDITTAANKMVKEHIKLLHEYNELKDVGQGLMGLIADQRGVRIVEVQDEFGIDAND